MSVVLIPITEPAGAARAVSRLLAEPRDPRLVVRLLAAVEPMRPGKVRMFGTEEEAEAQVRAAAVRWLAPLEASLGAAGIAFASQVVVGSPRSTVRAAAMQEDVNRVLLAPSAARCLSSRERRHLYHQPHHPVTLVA
jgi:nucleotide-binding universal stress UspA family protein